MDDKKPGDRLRGLRMHQGLSQGELAKEIGVSRTTVKNWETGVSDMTGHSLMKICEHLHATPAQVYGQEADTEDWRMRMELMDIYCSMSDEGRLALVSAARGMEKAFKKGRKAK